jgi:hypothetical protein
MRRTFTDSESEILTGMLEDIKKVPPEIANFRTDQPIDFRFLLLSIEGWPSYPTFHLGVFPETSTTRSQFEIFGKQYKPST